MRNLLHDREAVDAEYRVVRVASCLPIRLAWRNLVALLLAPVLMVLIGGGAYLGHPIAGWCLAMFAAAGGALITPHHKHLAIPAMGLGLLLGLAGCSQASSSTASPEQPVRKADVRAATRYQDPKVSWKPKPLPLPGAPLVESCRQEKCSGRH